jgi:hypothetical protein
MNKTTFTICLLLLSTGIFAKASEQLAQYISPLKGNYLLQSGDENKCPQFMNVEFLAANAKKHHPFSELTLLSADQKDEGKVLAHFHFGESTLCQQTPDNAGYCDKVTPSRIETLMPFTYGELSTSAYLDSSETLIVQQKHSFDKVTKFMSGLRQVEFKCTYQKVF